ncbi:MAG: nodulation protein NfeD [Geobacteraceae bacterium]|nr:nodulation protein NfeD [Geobacteraceae bacterium]
MRWLIVLLLLSFIGPSYGAGTPARIMLVAINGPINPATFEYVHRNLLVSASRHDPLFLIQMDSPGGLDSSMRDIVKDILSSPVPVAVYIAPSGARAASAGAIISIAADICAMAPGTNIGAAHPVSLGQQPDKVMQNKILNDSAAYVAGIAAYRGRNADMITKMVRSSESLTAEKALETKVVDFMASDRKDLLGKINGRSFRKGETLRKIDISGALVEIHEMGARERILNVIGDPNIAYILMMIGFLGLFFELSTPGAILPGVIGGISLLLSFFAFQTLPINYAGVLLILLAMILFIAEIKIVSHGMLAVGGVVSLFFGSLLLVDSGESGLQINWGLIVMTISVITGLALIVIRKAVKVHRKTPVSGKEGLHGEKGVADSEIRENGKVFVRGEYWDAWSDDSIGRGEKIEVVGLEGMRLKVKKV